MIATSNTWVIITDPGCVPQQKGPFNRPGQLKQFLKEAMAGRPDSHLMVAYSDGGLIVEDGTQALEILDGRSSPTARKHRDRLKAQSRCEDCPGIGYPTDKTRCLPCDRRAASTVTRHEQKGAI